MRHLAALLLLAVSSTRLEATSDAGEFDVIAQSTTEASPIPPPVGQTRADCLHPTYATDMLVCGDAALKAKDEDMATLLARAGARALSGDAPLLEPQEAWFRRRSLCAFREDQRGCVSAAYDERLAVIRSLSAAVDLKRPTFACRPSWQTGAIVSRAVGGGIVIAGIGAKSIGVGLPAIKGSGWRPYVMVEPRGRHALHLSTEDGASLLCAGSDGVR